MSHKIAQRSPHIYPGLLMGDYGNTNMKHDSCKQKRPNNVFQLLKRVPQWQADEIMRNSAGTSFSQNCRRSSPRLTHSLYPRQIWVGLSGVRGAVGCLRLNHNRRVLTCKNHKDRIFYKRRMLKSRNDVCADWSKRCHTWACNRKCSKICDWTHEINMFLYR